METWYFVYLYEGRFQGEDEFWAFDASLKGDVVVTDAKGDSVRVGDPDFKNKLRAIRLDVRRRNAIAVIISALNDKFYYPYFDRHNPNALQGTEFETIPPEAQQLLKEMPLEELEELSIDVAADEPVVRSLELFWEELIRGAGT